MISAVIGAQYGDEGKGLLVDYLSDDLTLVVRYNGGAQAGHTVVLPDGRSHEFHHFGAGCFKAACTLLSRFFVSNPILFRQEFEDPELAGSRRTLYVDRRSVVTTPYDMILNVAVERARGSACHGSCGVGINETVTRSERGPRLTVADIFMGRIASILDDIRYCYVPLRAQELGIAVPDECDLPGLDERFAEDCAFFEAHATPADDVSAIASSSDVVFEGAQGLRLDEQAPGFPHVTRSRTGLTNVVTLLREAGRGLEPLSVHYVTRSYVTRHGAGPLCCEIDGHPWGWVGHETNVWNEHQGNLRYAHLHASDLRGAIQADMRESAGPSVSPSLVVTCLDQSMGRYGVREAQQLAEFVGVPLSLVAAGSTREDVLRVRAGAEVST